MQNRTAAKKKKKGKGERGSFTSPDPKDKSISERIRKGLFHLEILGIMIMRDLMPSTKQGGDEMKTIDNHGYVVYKVYDGKLSSSDEKDLRDHLFQVLEVESMKVSFWDGKTTVKYRK